jgi:SAM-dependent methyltransferase
MPWAQEISLDGRPGPFENVRPVGELADRALWEPFDNLPLTRPLAECIKRDPYPLPATADREGYHGERHYEHWMSGLRDFANVVARLAAHDITLPPGSPVLDFGCASGRVLRHFLCQGENLDLWGADINRRNVEWVRRFLAPTVRIFQSTVLPHLPVEDNSFSLVYAFSVFTHIDEFELAWLLELRRLLKPGGVAYLTLHTDHTWNIMSPKLTIYHALMNLREHLPELNLRPEMFREPMPAERFVAAARTATVYNVNIFHTTEYIRSTWGRFFEILDIHREGAGYQDAVVLRKR